MLFQSIILSISALTLIVLAVVVMRAPRISQAHQFLAIFMGAAAVWSLGIAGFLVSTDHTVARFAVDTYYLAAIVIVYISVYMVLALPVNLDKRRNISYFWQILGAIPALFAVMLVVNHGALVQSIDVSAVGQNTVELNPRGYVAYALIFLIYAGLAAAALVYKLSLTKLRVQRVQLKYVAGSLLSGLAFGGIFNLILPLFGNYNYIWIGPLCGIPVVVVVFYSIMRFGVFDIKQATVRTTAYVLSLSSILVIYYAISVLLSQTVLRDQYLSDGGVFISAGLIVIGVLLFSPVKQFFDRVTDRVFFRDKYDESEFYSQLNGELTESNSLRGLLARASSVIASTLKASQVYFVVYTDAEHHISAGTTGYAKPTEHDIGIISQLVKGHPGALVLETQLPYDDELGGLLRSYDLTAVLPLSSRGQLVGFMALGEHLSRGYARRDIEVVNSIADGMVIAISNLLSTQEVRGLNSGLKQRIDEATEELRAKNERLKQLDATKDEFISMASHQLRTPLTSIKGYISMVLEGDVGDILPEQKQLLSEAFDSSERMVHLIGDFLNVSRLQNGKFIVDYKPCDMLALVNQEVESMRSTAEMHGMRIELSLIEDTPEMYLDDNKIRQVVMNFIDNAIYYSPGTDKIEVSLDVVGDNLEFQVRDYGMGVPDAAKSKMFTKFYRADNARTQRPDGTGIGLYLARKIIESHDGEVIFESQVGKGSRFGFKLPVGKLSVIKD